MDTGSDTKVYPLVSTDYELLEEVGQGVSAIVYRAICVPFKEVVAIKSLDMERCNSNLEDIRREVQTMSLIDHPNVIKAYCSFMVGHFLWVVMPYMSGGSCLHIMKAAFPNGFEEPIIATILKDTLKALDYLHRNGHIHRDIKAGNILVDAHGGVKLADFGVSACMFDTGDRQRSRITFVGTPCWMAPEVMEQLHGYDFKADIWSFGITALELAHGHAPFSKYPPMKVLLMTLQNAPPGLDYERDKRFSKSFKEMIAICLVKDPAKRPSAEKLLKHSFFKHARSCHFVARRILDGLPPLWERVKALKVKDAARLAQNKLALVEKEERSQNEYRRGVSGWNFDVEDLKAQADLIQDDEGFYAHKHDDDQLRAHDFNLKEDIEICLDHSSSRSSPVAGIDSTGSSQGCKSLFMYRQDDETKIGEQLKEFRSGPLPTSTPCRPSAPKHVSAPLLFRTKEAKLIGRFNILEEDTGDEILCRNGAAAVVNRHNGTNNKRNELVQQHICEQNYSQLEHLNTRDNMQARVDESTSRRYSSGPLLSNVNASPCAQEVAREKDPRKNSRWLEDRFCDARQAKKGFSGPLTSDGVLRERFINYKSSCSGYNDLAEEKLRGSFLQKKGRFSVTSEDLQHTQAFPQASDVTRHFAENGSSNTVSIGAVLPHLESLCDHAAAQQDIILSLLSSLNSGEYLDNNGSLPSKDRSFGTNDLLSASGRECRLLNQVAGLKLRIATLMDDLQSAKSRNTQLESQLSQILYKQEKERT